MSVCLSVSVWESRTYRPFGGGNGEWKNIIFPPPPRHLHSPPLHLLPTPCHLPRPRPPTNFSSTLIQTFYPMVRTFPGLRVLPERFLCKGKSRTFSLKKDLYVYIYSWLEMGAYFFSICSFIARSLTNHYIIF